MKSHAILRTNTGLTTNAKLVVRPNYELYLDCIDSSPELNDNKFRKYRFSKDNYWDEVLPKFFRNTPTSISYKVKYDNDNNVMFKDFGKQYDDLYYYGARNIYDNKDYLEEFEYFAPLHITKSKLPSNFIIFRVDGPGIIELTKDNFREEIVNKLKVVQIFDLTPKTDLGEFLKKNITDNPNYPATSLDIDFKKLEFSYFIGIDYETGGYTKRSQMLENFFSKEMTFSDMEKFFYDGFKNNQIIYPHIINFSFLFDDTPATPTSLRKWSINRYLGFYINSMVSITKISPNSLPKLKNNVLILKGNILETNLGDAPFLDEKGLGNYPYVELNGKFYLVQKYTELQDEKRVKVQTSSNAFSDKFIKIPATKYKILSDTSLEGLQTNLNKNLVYIETKDGKNVIYGENRVDKFDIDNFDDADFWLIKIGEKYHKLIKNSDGYIEIITDYGFLQSSDKFEFYINQSDKNYTKSISLALSEYQGPVEFEIFKCEMSDIKDWDTEIVETDFSKYEYEEETVLTENDEPKLYLTNLNSKSDPLDLDDYILSNKVVHIPVSSEYTANHETFRLVENDLSDLWRKNPQRVKWGFQNSLSDGDYPYLLNNSLIADNFNKTVNPYSLDIVRSEKVLDYFYSINSSDTKFKHQTLHIQPISSKIDPGYVFDVNKYVKTDLDYFGYFFGQKTDFSNGQIIKNTYKWSNFNPSDGMITNNTLFRGLKFKIYDVSSVSADGGIVNNLNLKLTNQFDDYKFSILFSENESRVEVDQTDVNKGVTQSFINNMRWAIIEEWKMDKFYKQNEIVYWNNYFYVSNKDHITTDPDQNPHSLSWKSSTTDPSDPINSWIPIQYASSITIDAELLRFADMIFLNPTKANDTSLTTLDFPLLHQIAFFENEFFVLRNPVTGPTPTIYIWGPGTYNPDSKVYFKGKYWKSMSLSFPQIKYRQQPGGNDNVVEVATVNGQNVVTQTPFWSEYTPTSTDVDQWIKLPLWDPTQTYGVPLDPNYLLPNQIYDYTVYNGVLYGMSASSIIKKIFPGESSPDLNSKWVRLFSFEPDTNYEYGDTVLKNNVISLNNRYYLYLVDPNADSPNVDQVLDKTLDQGITIYIHKKFKNILINIYVNDNTYKKYLKKVSGYLNYDVEFQMDFMKNIDREALYNDLFGKLSANNIMNALTDVNNKYGFANFIKYVIIEETGEVKIYDFNNLESAKNLPHFLSCEGPDEFTVQNNSIKKGAINVDENLLKPTFKLENGTIRTLGELNYFGDVPVANTVEVEKVEKSPIPNFSSLKNNLFTKIYRHSGFYSPIFKNIELFTSYTEDKNIGNFKFDTTLTDFGMSGERIISKINPRENLLKLSNSPNLKSIYPILDEFGYQVVKTFIFKSTWDLKFHYECKKPVISDKISNVKVQKPTDGANINLI